MNKKLLSLLLAGIMTVSLAACGDTNAANQPSGSAPSSAEQGDVESTGGADDESGADTSTAIDTSERVDLVFYVMGNAPKDEAMVEDAINEILLDKVNATVDFQFSTWTDYNQKYSMTLTSQAADLIYIANWLKYGQLAKSGAFLELDEMLDTVAPALKELVGEEKLNMCSVDGAVYAIPSAWSEYTCPGLNYREDLRVLYDLPVPDSLENMEAYFDGILANDPNQGILALTADSVTGNLQIGFPAAAVLNIKYPWVTNNGLPYGLAANYDTPNDVYDYWFSDDFVEDAKMFKRWADKGYWSRSALSDSNNDESYKNGLCVAQVSGMNPSKQAGNVTSFESAGDGWLSDYIAYGEVTGVIYPGHATQNGTSIVRGCKNPERALMVLELLMCDQELNNLVQAGIEGVHYEITEDGFYENLTPAGEDQPFPYEGFSTWNLRNGDYRLQTQNDVLLQDMFDKYETLGAQTKFPNTDIYSGFTEDYSAYQTERAAVSNVISQYLAPIQAGLVSDPEAAVEEFRAKVTEAGIQACQDGFEEQWHAYCEEYGYK